jgi:multisubunit Na+/H+ antiporter MnhG subunit
MAVAGRAPDENLGLSINMRTRINFAIMLALALTLPVATMFIAKAGYEPGR